MIRKMIRETSDLYWKLDSNSELFVFIVKAEDELSVISK
jgi:hypothetical protein